MSHALDHLVDNLRCRARLGLPLVRGDRAALDRLLSAAGASGTAGPAGAPAAPAAPARAGEGSGPAAGTLERIRANMGECKRCELHRGRNHIVFGDGPASAALMFIGEGPGQEEDRRGLPFVGAAGRLLDKMLAAVGLNRADVYIANLVKCRPPGNRDPRDEEVAACLPFLRAQIAAIAPRVICTLGKPAAHHLLATDAPISALRGNWRELEGVPLLPTFHPAYLLRSPAAKAQAYQDMKALARALRRENPKA